MNKKNLLATAIAAATTLSTGITCNIANASSIGIVVPLEHQAMQEIVRGFKDTMHKNYRQPVTIEIKNAEHDANIEQSIIHQMVTNKTDIIEPIGTDAFEMTCAQARHSAILGIATNFSNAQRLQQKPAHASSVADEVTASMQLNFIHKVMPKLKNITLIHSSDNKIFSEVAASKQSAKKLGITIQDIMVQTPAELYTAGQRVNKQAQAIFILKDHMIVSGAPTLAQVAQQHHIPLISSDDGSVQNGAAFALGVSEYQTGVVAAQMTIAALQQGGDLKYNIAHMPIRKVQPYQVFINPEQAQKQHAPLKALQQTAHAEKLGVLCYQTNKQVTKSC